jgi:hypothetical protein
MTSTVLPALLIASLAAADAGYLGSLGQGPSPAYATGGTGVRMAAEDVFIRMESCSSAVISAAFLFESSSAESVLVCYPVEVLTVFHMLWDAVLEEDGGQNPLDTRVRVMVDGEPAETFVLVQCDRDKSDEQLDADVSERYGWVGSGAGQPDRILVHRPPGSDSAAVAAIVPRADALLVCWVMGFEEDGTSLVEIEDTVRLTADYSGCLHRLAYPLVTGASWDGPIGRGRLSVTGAPGFDWSRLAWWSGVLMPPPAELSSFVPSPVSGLERSELLAPLMGWDLGRALVWEFVDFEPVAGRRDCYTYFPDTGDLGGVLSLYDAGGRAVDSPWESSFVYLYAGPDLPDLFTVIRTGGLGLHAFPSGPTVAMVQPGQPMGVLDRSGDWMKVMVTRRDGGEVTGWFEMHPLGGAGLVEPTAIPYPGSYWEP